MNRNYSSRDRESSRKRVEELDGLADDVLAKRSELRKKLQEVNDLAEEYFEAFDELEKAEAEYTDDD